MQYIRRYSVDLPSGGTGHFTASSDSKISYEILPARLPPNRGQGDLSLTQEGRGLIVLRRGKVEIGSSSLESLEGNNQ